MRTKYKPSIRTKYKSSKRTHFKPRYAFGGLYINPPAQCPHRFQYDLKGIVIPCWFKNNNCSSTAFYVDSVLCTRCEKEDCSLLRMIKLKKKTKKHRGISIEQIRENMKRKMLEDQKFMKIKNKRIKKKKKEEKKSIRTRRKNK